MANLGDWEPLQPDEVSQVLYGIDCRWWLSGGWSLDQLIGSPTRIHGDTDLTILREDATRVRRFFRSWDLHVADPPGFGTLQPWRENSELRPELHDIWCRRSPSDRWCLQLMVNEAESGDWIYRRDHRIRRPLETVSGRASTETMPVLAPEITLLYKSTDLRLKDRADFRRVVAYLEEGEKAWLRTALEATSPTHPWIAQL
jgi:hypothetical protein